MNHNSESSPYVMLMYAARRQVREVAAEQWTVEQFGAEVAPQNRHDVHAAAEANAVASVLSETASQGRPKRNRTAPSRLVDSST